MGDTNTARRTLQVGLFRNNTCIKMYAMKWTDASSPQLLNFSHVDSPQSSQVVTYSMRAAVAGGAVFYINQLRDGSDWGGTVNLSSFLIQEL